MKLAQTLFSFRGRLRRLPFIGFGIAAILTITLIPFLAIKINNIEVESEFADNAISIFFILLFCVQLLCYYILMALCSKRLHDMDSTAWHLLWIAPLMCAGPAVRAFAQVNGQQAIGSLPLILAFVTLVALAKTLGTDGPNSYGPGLHSAKTAATPAAPAE